MRTPGRKYFVCAVYSIKCIETGKTYIGSTRNLFNRFTTHRSNLKHGKHKNPGLQEDYNKYGGEQFVFSMVFEVCRWSGYSRSTRDFCIAKNIEAEIVRGSNMENLYNVVRPREYMIGVVPPPYRKAQNT